MDLIKALYCLTTFSTPLCRTASSPGLLSFACTLAATCPLNHHHCTLCSTLWDLSLFHNHVFAHAVPSGRNVGPCPCLFTGRIAAREGSSLSLLFLPLLWSLSTLCFKLFMCVSLFPFDFGLLKGKTEINSYLHFHTSHHVCHIEVQNACAMTIQMGGICKVALSFSKGFTSHMLYEEVDNNISVLLFYYSLKRWDKLKMQDWIDPKWERKADIKLGISIQVFPSCVLLKDSDYFQLT